MVFDALCVSYKKKKKLKRNPGVHEPCKNKVDLPVLISKIFKIFIYLVLDFQF